MARAVAEGAAGSSATEWRIASTKEAKAEDLLWCDGIAVGSPTNFGSIAWEMKKWWDEVPFDLWLKLDGKIGCAFSSSGGWGGGAELNCMTILTVLMNYGLLVFGVTDYVGHKFTAHYGAVVAGEPREEREIESCRRLGQRLAEFVAVHHDGRLDAHPLRQSYAREHPISTRSCRAIRSSNLRAKKPSSPRPPGRKGITNPDVFSWHLGGLGAEILLHVPKRRSPASPSPGRIKPFSLSCRSTAAQ